MVQLQVKVVTPEKEIFNDLADRITVQSLQGELGILPHHANLMAELKPGELRIEKGSKTDSLATGGGFIQITDNQVVILTDLAEYAQDIDEKAVETAKKRAEEALEQKLGAEEYADTLAALERSLAQLHVKRRHRAR